MVVTDVPQISRPVAVRVSGSVQVFGGMLSTPLKVVPCPGAKLAITVTGVLGAGTLFTITMFVIVTLPTLVMVPVKPRTPPGRPLVCGQSLLITSPGLRTFEQVAEQLVLVVNRYGPVAVSVPLTKMVSVNGPHAGAASLPLKLNDWPTANIGTFDKKKS